VKKGILLLGHGSRRSAANEDLEVLADLVRAGLGMTVLPVYFQFGSPSLGDGVERFIQEGIQDIIIIPVFLFPGNHLEIDIPEAISELEGKHGGQVRLTVTPCLGPDPRLAEILVERAHAVIKNSDEYYQELLRQEEKEFQDPVEITARSRKLIDGILGENFFNSRFTGLQGEIVRRVVHATGNTDAACLMRFHPAAIEAGLAALKKGTTLFTDVSMVEMGISKPGLLACASKLICLIDDPRVWALAQQTGLTRALVAVRYNPEVIKDNIMVIGNAPTALTEVLRQAEQGVRPALIIGTPVGFVGAAESKARLCNQQVPYITMIGNQGGSTVAVAIVNALLALAQGKAGL